MSTGTNEPRVSVRNLMKVFRGRRGEVPALKGVSLDIAPGEILVLLGPSGCGKTTLLRCVAGLERPDSGEIVVQGRTVFSSATGTSLPPELRNLSMVFQSYALWPHMTVFQNVAYPLKNAGVGKDEVQARTTQVLAMVGLGGLENAHPGQLSGGQQQRVALARAIVGNDGVVLFDEPLSNLDAKVRERLRIELLALQRDIRFSALYVTHDQVEASALADRLAVMDVGEIAQMGTPIEVYRHPSSRYVAQFIGSANEVQGSVVSGEEGVCRVTTGLGELAASCEGTLTAGQRVSVLFRPEHCRVTSTGTGGMNAITCRLERSMFLGSHVEHILRAGSDRLVIRTMDESTLPAETDVKISVRPDQTWAFAQP